jgi:8-oxo-dGTP diphosphatase
MKVDFYEGDAEVRDENIIFAVIVAKYKDQWIVVRHKQRSTWEIPGGHREKSENLHQTAERELYEETGAQQFIMFPVCVYSVTRNEECSYGKLFYAEVKELGQLPEMEIAEIKVVEGLLQEDLTYPLIQPILFEKVQQYLFQGGTKI